MRQRSHLLVTSAVSALLGVTGCKKDPVPDAEPEVAASARNHLVWKRYHAVEQDLSRALELEPEALCTELDKLNCIHEVHLAGLGGHEPFKQGLYEPLSEPLVTTPLALDRVVLSACGERVARDQTTPVVFSALDLSGEAPSADSEAFLQTVQVLYQRLLSRDPLDAEYTAIANLLHNDAGERVSSAQFAHLACFTVATTTEFLFF